MADRFSETLAPFASWLKTAFQFPKARGARLIRPRYPRVIAGVCSGVAQAYGYDATLLRVLVVVLGVASSGIVALGYVVAWVLIPEGSYSLPGRAGTSAS